MGFESLPNQTQIPEQPARFLEGNAVRSGMVKHLESMSQRIDINTLQGMDPEDPRGRTFKHVTVEHGNLEIEMMGVAHTVETLPRHRGKIESAIKNSDFFILESVVEANDSNLTRGKGGSAVSSDGMFFLEVERMVRKHGKGLVTMDPYYGDGIREEEHRDEMEKSEKLVKDTRRLVGAAGMVTSIAGAAFSAHSLQEVSSQGKGIEESKISRRDFLKLSAAGASALLSHKVASVETEARNYGDVKTGVPTFDYQLNDYRDVVIAEGIDMMSRSFTKKKKVSLLFGAHHLKGIRYYLDHSDIRRAKLALYKPFQQKAEPKLRAYHFEMDKRVSEKESQKGNFGEWQKDVEMIIKTPQ